MITGQAAMLRVQIRGKNMYYAQKIKEDVPIRDVIEYYYGQQPGKGGIHCPNPAHRDSNPSASIKNNRCKSVSYTHLTLPTKA